MKNINLWFYMTMNQFFKLTKTRITNKTSFFSPPKSKNSLEFLKRSVKRMKHSKWSLPLLNDNSLLLKSIKNKSKPWRNWKKPKFYSLIYNNIIKFWKKTISPKRNKYKKTVKKSINYTKIWGNPKKKSRLIIPKSRGWRSRFMRFPKKSQLKWRILRNLIKLSHTRTKNTQN
jgi:hypothetical protein